MFKFIKRFLFAWKLACNPEAFMLLLDEAKSRGELQQIRMAAIENAKVAMVELVPENRHAYRKDMDITLNIQCAEICTPEEAYADAARVIAESRIENKVTLSNGWITPLGNKNALIEHDKKRHEPKLSE